MRAFVFGRRPWVRAVVVVGSTLVLLGSWLALGGTAPAQATETTLATFTSPGPNWWTVPAGVTKITFTVYGASGGAVVSGSPPTLISVGGAGGEAKGTFRVKPGEKFEIVVGGHGYNNNGQVGGYGGSGNSCSTPYNGCTEFDRIIVAGGGGGAGQNSDGGAGGGVSAGCGDTAPCTGKQEGSQCTFVNGFGVVTGCFGWGASGSSGTGQPGGGGGWFGGNHGYLNELGGGGGGSGFISGAALKGSFPGGTHGGDGLVIITTP